jgi:hypothetical protein
MRAFMHRDALLKACPRHQCLQLLLLLLLLLARQTNAWA